MIWYALSKGNREILTPQSILENGYIIDKKNLSKLIASPGTSYDFVAQSQQSQAYVVLKSDIAFDDPTSTIGIFAPLGPQLETVFAQRNLRITVSARQGQDTPLSDFYIAYFTADVGDSGWKKKTLTPEWKNYVMKFTPKAPVNTLEADYFGILPGDKGGQKTMDIQSIKIDIIPQRTNSPY